MGKVVLSSGLTMVALAVLAVLSFFVLDSWALRLIWKVVLLPGAIVLAIAGLIVAALGAGD